VVEVGADATLATVSVRCMDARLDTAAGHTHDLRLNEVRRTVSVPANSTTNETVTCADDAKGIVASYELSAGLLLAGHDPQPKSRVFKLVNPTGGPLTAKLDLLCAGDRTGGAVVTTRITNSATVSSATPDVDGDDQAASATVEVTAGDPQPPPVTPPLDPVRPPDAPARAGVASIDGGKATVSATDATAISLPVSCDGACSGAITLRAVAGGTLAPGKRLGGGAYAVTAGEATVAARLTRKAGRLVSRGKLRKLGVELSYGDPADPQISSRVLKLRSR
jgi:hypothetical protein